MIPKAGILGLCPWCGIQVRFESATHSVRGVLVDTDGLNIRDGISDKQCNVDLARCTNRDCRKTSISFDGKLIRPLGSVRPACPAELPTSIADDYNDACNVELISEKASAALSRRCLQNLLHDQGIKKANLEQEIEEAMSNLPSNLADDIDAIRHVGNFAAHPLKSTSTGEIVDVEPEEAAYLLETLYDLFDFYYVKPTKSAAKRQALQDKLDAAGKNVQIKQS